MNPHNIVDVEKRNSIFRGKIVAKLENWKIYEQFSWLRLAQEVVVQGAVFQNIFLMANFLDENFPCGNSSRVAIAERMGRWQFFLFNFLEPTVCTFDFQEVLAE